MRANTMEQTFRRSFILNEIEDLRRLQNHEAIKSLDEVINFKKSILRKALAEYRR